MHTHVVKETIEVSADDLAAMAKVITKPVRVEDVAAVAVRAGAMEMLALATGRAVFSTINDLKQYRVYCLLRCGLRQGDAPDVVKALFQIEIGPAKTLVNRTLARYRVELQEGWFGPLGDALADAKWVKPSWEFTLTPFLLDRLTEAVTELAVRAPAQVDGSTYSMENASFQAVLLRLDKPRRAMK